MATSVQPDRFIFGPWTIWRDFVWWLRSYTSGALYVMVLYIGRKKYFFSVHCFQVCNIVSFRLEPQVKAYFENFMLNRVICFLNFGFWVLMKSAVYWSRWSSEAYTLLTLLNSTVVAVKGGDGVTSSSPFIFSESLRVQTGVSPVKRPLL